MWVCLCVKERKDCLLFGFAPRWFRSPCGPSSWVVPSRSWWSGAAASSFLVLRCLGFVMSASSFSSLPDALVDLRREVLAYELEARDLRSWGRPALAIAVEREMRAAQERFEKAALAYRKLGLI